MSCVLVRLFLRSDFLLWHLFVFFLANVFISGVSCECQKKERKEKVAINFLASKTSHCDQLVHVKV